MCSSPSCWEEMKMWIPFTQPHPTWLKRLIWVGDLAITARRGSVEAAPTASPCPMPYTG